MYIETSRTGPKSGLQLTDYAEPHRSPTSKKKGFPFHCLVVDDERRNRHLVTRMIEALGHKADKASNSDHAVSKFAANGHNLVLTDLDMPYLDGYALAVRIKKAFRDAKIVIMTHRCQAEVSDMMSTGTVDAWLFKPFGLDELYKVLDALQSADGKERQLPIRADFHAHLAIQAEKHVPPEPEKEDQNERINRHHCPAVGRQSPGGNRLKHRRRSDYRI